MERKPLVWVRDVPGEPLKLCVQHSGDGTVECIDLSPTRALALATSLIDAARRELLADRPDTRTAERPRLVTAAE